MSQEPLPEAGSPDHENELLKNRIAELERELALEGAARERLESLVDALYVTLYETDERGFFLWVNQAAVQAFGYSREEIARGLHVLQVIAPEDRERAAANVRQVIATGGGGSRDYIALRKDGSRFPIRLHPSPVRDAPDRPYRLRGFVMDISEQHAREEALKASRERLRAIFDTVADGIIVMDTEGRITAANRSTLRLFGAAHEPDLLGKRGVSLVIEKDRQRIHKAFQDLVLNRKPMKVEYTALSSDGSRFPAEATGTCFWEGSGELVESVGVVTVIKDITDRQTAFMERLRASRLESTGLLAGGIAHDFNNLLAAILGNISLAQAQIDNTDKVLTRLDLAERVVLRARDLTSQLLTFAKGGAPVTRTTSIEDLLKECTLFALRGSKVSCRLLVADELWLVDCDPGQISQVFQNLILNADQAMPEGGQIEIRASNTLLDKSAGHGDHQGPFVRVEVHDQGAGIAPEHLPNLFVPYFTTKVKGTGLGLATAWSIVQRHGGFMDALSPPGQGATFVIYLPASSKALQAQPPAEHKESTRRGPILVMDDQETIRDVLKGMLESLGYPVELCANGQEAVELYRARQSEGRPFLAVILDLTIPGGMGGEETMRRLKEIDPQVRGIASSGYSSGAVMANSEKHGFQAAIAKPYRMEELSLVLAEAIG